MKKTILLSIIFCLTFKSFSQKPTYGIDDLTKIPAAPDYSNIKFWVAHPDWSDQADLVPGRNQLKEDQNNAAVDVFFVYPTIYSKKQDPDNPWFADVNDKKLNEEVANSTIKYQASVFNASGKVYSPFYRQAHIKVFYSDSTLKAQALDFAYQDVKSAFEFYMENWNNDRPIIIASHSQGTVHAARLLHEYFEDKPLMEKLVAAYIIGMPVQKDEFSEIPLCESSDDTGCWMTWNTYARDYYPANYEKWYSKAASMNPISWTLTDDWASWDENKGGILKNFKKIRPGLTDAQNHEGLLWIHKPKFLGNFLINWKRYHVVDYNLFYLNIRENVSIRVAEYLEQKN